MAVTTGAYNRILQELQAKRSRESDLIAIVVVTTVICVSLLRPWVGAAVLVVGGSLYAECLRRWPHASDGTNGGPDAPKLLSALPASFTVVDQISLDGYDIDHLVVGPSGVWVVDVEWHKGVVAESAQAIELNARPMHRDPRRRAQASAVEIGRLIERSVGIRCRVHSLVCFPRATVRSNGSPALTSVVDRQQLSARLRCGSGRLDPDQYTRIAGALLALKNDG